MVDHQPPSSRVTAKLVLFEGPEGHPPQPVFLTEKDIVIGRGNGCDVTWSSLQISRRHATLEYINRKWFIRDCSTNGLSVGSEKLTKGIARELKHRELIHFIPTGALVYRFESSESPPPAIKTEPPVVTVEDDIDDDNNSNHSESLLSVSGHIDDFYDAMPHFNMPNNGQQQVQQELNQTINPPQASTAASSSGALGKRKNPIVSDTDAESLNRKKQRKWDSVIAAFMKDEEIVADDDDDDDSDLLECLAPSVKNTSSSDSQLVESIKSCGDVEALRKKCLSFYQKFKLTQAENQSLKMEKTIEQEENRRKQNDAQSRTEAYKEELFKQIVEALEQEFSCCICNEIFIQPTVVDCGHTFCGFCIGEWTRKKPECPICRKLIRNPTKHVEMDNFLIKIHSMLSVEVRTRRDQAICERVEAKDKAAVRAAAEARPRRNAVPNGDYFPFPPRMADRLPLPFDLLAELQSIDEHPWPPPPAHSTSNNNDRRRSERIRGRNPNNPPGTTNRGGRGRYARQPGLDILGIHGNRHIADDQLIMLPNMEGGQQQQQQQGGDQAGTSRASSMYNLLIAGNPGVQVPDFRGNPMGRGNYFPMFPFGAAMGRPEDGHPMAQPNRRGPPIANIQHQNPNPGNMGMGPMDVLLVE